MHGHSLCCSIGIEDGDAVLSVFLRGIKRVIDPLVEALLELALAGDGDTEAGADGEIVREDMGMEKVILHADGECLSRFQCGTGKDDEEFIAAPAAGVASAGSMLLHDVG